MRLLLSFLALWMMAGVSPGENGEASFHVDKIVRGLTDSSEARQREAILRITAWQWSALEARQIISPLVRVAENSPLRSQALTAISVLAEQQPEEIEVASPALAKLLGQGIEGQENLSQRDICNLVLAFGYLEKSGKPASEYLRTLMSEKNWHPYLGIWAAASLARIEQDNRESIDYLRSQLKGANKTVAAQSLGWVGPIAKPALPELETMMEAGNEPERVVAASALWKIKDSVSPKMLRVLIDALDDDPVVIRSLPMGPSTAGYPHSAYAAKTLGAIGGEAKQAVPALQKAQHHGDVLLKKTATEAIKSISNREKK